MTLCIANEACTIRDIKAHYRKLQFVVIEIRTIQYTVCSTNNRDDTLRAVT